jgi:hypothetical protein
MDSPLKVQEWEVTGGMLPSVRQSKRTEGVSTSTVSSGVGGGRTKAASPPNGREGGREGPREERERER